MRNQRRQRASKRPMEKLKEFHFIVRNENGKERAYVVHSMTLNGAVRRLYQENEIETLLRICEVR